MDAETRRSICMRAGQCVCAICGGNQNSEIQPTVQPFECRLEHLKFEAIPHLIALKLTTYWLLLGCWCCWICSVLLLPALAKAEDGFECKTTKMILTIAIWNATKCCPFVQSSNKAILSLRSVSWNVDDVIRWEYSRMGLGWAPSGSRIMFALAQHYHLDVDYLIEPIAVRLCSALHRRSIQAKTIRLRLPCAALVRFHHMCSTMSIMKQ